VAQRIEPFRGLHYDPSRSGDFAAIVAPPYDLIDKSRQDGLYARSPYNVVRLELNREADPYSSAAWTFGEWVRGGVLKRAARPAIYLYSQFFAVDGRQLRRDGLIARVRLEEFSAGRISPHERTFPAAKQDRLNLITALRANTSSIFGLYAGAHPALEQTVEPLRAREPDLAVTDDLGIRNELRGIEERATIEVIQRALETPRVLIADGHHRYETALEYRRRRRAAEGDPEAAQPYDYTMMTLVACDSPGLVILPTHRLARRLDPDAVASFDESAAQYFTVEQFADPDALRAALARAGRGAIGAALGGKRMMLRMLRLKDGRPMAEAMPQQPEAVRRLDVSALHVLVLHGLFAISPDQIKAGGSIEYTIDAGAALREVAENRAAGAFLMNPPTVADVEAVSGAGAVMPEKSTYFFPKLITGLVLNPLDDDVAAGAAPHDG
jgi:uncharacterized protein (DUF1015 family)